MRRWRRNQMMLLTWALWRTVGSQLACRLKRVAARQRPLRFPRQDGWWILVGAGCTSA